MKARALRRRGVVLAGQVGLLVAWLASWELVGRPQPVLLSFPTEVAAGLLSLIESAKLQDLIVFTARTFALGWGISVVLGIVIGTAVGWSRPVALMFEPFINALYATPKIVLIPLMILWFGLDLKAYVASVVVGAVFPVMIMTITGVRNAGREYVEVARSFHVSGFSLLYNVVLPGAMPFIAVGLRLSMGRAIGGAIAAEFFLGGGGIGAAVQAAGQSLASADMYGFILMIAASAMAVDLLFRRVWGVISPVRS